MLSWTPQNRRKQLLKEYSMSVSESINEPNLFAFSLVPLAVLQLRVKHANETSLGVMWQTPVAEWDKYIISLADRDLLLIHKSLSRDAKEFTFTDLVPGRKYTATVTSISGDLKNSSSIKGRTGNNLYKY
jgi:hypothetical protein